MAMHDRSRRLLSLRPERQEHLLLEHTGSDERFQNETLRPIMVLQNDLFIEAFKNYARKHKGTFYELSATRRLDYIENAIQKDAKFRNGLKGMVIGQFTVAEYRRYIENSSALNKRMMSMVIERLKDQVLVLGHGEEGAASPLRKAR